jgi:Tfp pilus assembly protein PilN
MRPVNLIPTEERPGGRRPLRSGPLAYIVVGALAAAVIALTAVVVTESKISDRKAEVTTLKREQASVESKAHALASYTQFSTVREQRLATVTSLADSRFGWERVLHELSLVLPDDIRLTSLAGTSAPGIGTAGGAGIAMRSEIAGPALEMVGCGTSQAAIAGFVEALKGIDGVTRVGMQGSAMSGGESGANAASASACGGKSQVAQFEMVVAFDAAPLAPSESGEEVAPEVPAEGTAETTAASSETPDAGETSSSESTAK